MVEATDKLISAGLRLSRAPRFTLLSDSCFPSQPLEKFYAFVERDDREFVFALDALVAEQGAKKKHLMGVCFFDVAALNPRRFRPGLARSLLWQAFRLTSRIPRLRRSDFESRNIIPYFGSQWWTLSRACLEHVASPPPAMLWFKERLRWSYAGDEFFIPTAVMNSPCRQRVHQLDRLEELKLINRQPDPNDGRGSLVSLTSLGMKKVDEALDQLIKNERAFLTDLNKAEQAELADLLSRLAANFDIESE